MTNVKVPDNKHMGFYLFGVVIHFSINAERWFLLCLKLHFTDMLNNHTYTLSTLCNIHISHYNTHTCCLSRLWSLISSPTCKLHPISTPDRNMECRSQTFKRQAGLLSFAPPVFCDQLANRRRPAPTGGRTAEPSTHLHEDCRWALSCWERGSEVLGVVQAGAN